MKVNDAEVCTALILFLIVFAVLMCVGAVIFLMLEYKPQWFRRTHQRTHPEVYGGSFRRAQ